MTAFANIGESSAERVSEIRQLIESINIQQSSEGLAVLDNAVEKMERESVTISFVGQVKAGKSSLINALAGLGDLLPTEVNPWTAVITNLHFGHPMTEEYTAQFKLFSEEEWERMLNGDSETRSMAEEFLPGFSSEVLEAQVREMQENARARLGDLYHHLLGKVHNFTSVNREILERYVCAGYAASAGDKVANEGVGRLSTITKSAEVFLPSSPFCIPATVSDTPGINDPFLVRDEITTGSLKKADVFVVTISAHQPLNPADIALLKMLSKHSTKRMIIFVNRCDELGEPAEDLPAILKSLDKRLTKEIQEPNYILCAGSAFWGQTAATGTDEEVEAITSTDDFKAVCDSLIIDPEMSDRERLDAASGLADLRDTMSRLLLNGPINRMLGDVSVQAGAALDLMVPMMDEQIRREEEKISGGTKGMAEDALKRADERGGALTNLGKELDFIAENGRKSVETVSGQAIENVKSAVQAAVEEFIAEQAEDLKEELSSGPAKKRWALDYNRLRDFVDQNVVESYSVARAACDEKLFDYAIKLNTEIAPVFGAVQFGPLTESLPHGEIIPGFKPRSEMIEMDLSSDRGWKFWKSKRMGADEAVSAMEKLVYAELASAQRDVDATITEAFTERSAAAMERFDGILKTTKEMAGREQEEIKAEVELYSSGQNEEKLEAMLQEKRARLETQKEEASVLRDIRDRLRSAFEDEAQEEEQKAAAAS